jgi:UDP-N-acetylmuramate--alanine ligase
VPAALEGGGEAGLGPAGASAGHVREAPLDGRRIWFVGIGGAGLSAYAKLARARGAEIGGWDRVETPYLAGLDAVEIAPEPVVPDGWEVVVSSAYPQVRGRPRAEFLAELVSLQPSIVVSGAHGKTTTTAMIAFVLAETGRDPAYLIGGDVPQLGGNAGAGWGWLVVEGDESDRTVESLDPEIGIVLNVELDHHATFASEAEVADLFERWLARVPNVVRGWELEPVDFALAVPGEHNRLNAAAALAALELAGVSLAEAAPVLARFEGVGRRFTSVGEAGGVRVVDDYAHHPSELAATIAAAREQAERVHVLFQPHLPSRTRHLARELGLALAGADTAVVTEIYAAREEIPPGLSGRLVVEALAEARPGMRVGWAPTVEQGAQLAAAFAEPGDLVVTVGAGDVDRAGPLILEALR